MKIISRSDAYRLGLKRFYTGVPCRHGHVSERYVSTQSCIACLKGHFDGFVKLTFTVDARDVSTVNEYVEAIIAARALTPDTDLEKKQRALSANLRRAGCPEDVVEKMVRDLARRP